MKEILIPNAIKERSYKYNYGVDKKGNLYREKYSYMKDWRTYLVLFLALMGFLYYSEVKTARQFIDSPCVNRCLVEQYVNDFRIKNPSVQIKCDYELRSCSFFGVIDDSLRNQFEIRGLNVTYG